MKKFFFLLLVACALSTALPVIALSAESQADTATENSDSEVFVDDSDRFTAFEEELLARYADKGSPPMPRASTSSSSRLTGR